MFAKIIGFFSCLLCAFPLFIMGVYGKDSLEPITFWTGDTTLKGRVGDVKSYNAELSSLYKKCALAFVITGILFFISIPLGTIAICFDCLPGIYIVYRIYKKVLNKYRKEDTL